MSEDKPNAEQPNRQLPKSGDVLSAITADNPQGTSRTERQFARKTEERAVPAQLEYEHLKGVKDHYTHKGRWSFFLMCAVGGMLIFQSVLLVRVGQGRLDFSSYEWLLPALLVQNLGQVIGLAVYAVKYLFSDISNQR